MALVRTRRGASQQRGAEERIHIVTTEEQFAERWKELEAATRLAFPTWAGRDMEKFLKQMRVEGVDFTRLMALRTVRNVLTHNLMLNGSPLVRLNEGLIPFLDGVIENIRRLPTASNILIPRTDVFSGSLNDAIRPIVDVMLEKVFSHVPILDVDGKVLGVFSESTMLEINKAEYNNTILVTMRDIADFLPMDKHTADVFMFVPRNDAVLHLRQLCDEALRKRQRIGMFFVTETGKSDEPLLGILTVWDIAGASDVNDI